VSAGMAETVQIGHLMTFF